MLATDFGRNMPTSERVERFMPLPILRSIIDAITVVNVEAERESVAVNPDPADLPRGATVFPKVEGVWRYALFKMPFRTAAKISARSRSPPTMLLRDWESYLHTNIFNVLAY
jgi:hypothetical protein